MTHKMSCTQIPMNLVSENYKKKRKFKKKLKRKGALCVCRPTNGQKLTGLEL